MDTETRILWFSLDNPTKNRMKRNVNARTLKKARTFTHCQRCRLTNYQLQFHHVFGKPDRRYSPNGNAQNVFNPSRLTTNQLLRELIKCVPLCYACHKEVHRLGSQAERGFQRVYTDELIRRFVDEAWAEEWLDYEQCNGFWAKGGERLSTHLGDDEGTSWIG